jgi:hypothetical protein
MAQLPHVLKRIRLNLARSRQFPEGSSRHGYEFVAPLDIQGHIDPDMWRQHRDLSLPQIKSGHIDGAVRRGSAQPR